MAYERNGIDIEVWPSQRTLQYEDFTVAVGEPGMLRGAYMDRWHWMEGEGNE